MNGREPEPASMPSDVHGLSTAALPMLRDLVQEHLGVSYDAARLEMLGDRLAPLVLERGFQSYLDYYYLLKYDAAAVVEWQRVMDALSVPETYFWREIDQISAVVDNVLPKLVRQAPLRPIQIWSAPCATGEEPLTIAMALDRAGWFGRAAIEIHAADGSPAAIERARAGRYRERAFRSLPPALREQYFRPDGDMWLVDPSLHGRIRSWRVMNLMSEDQLTAMAGAPVVFCRNVFIYFSTSGVRRVVETLARLMATPSYLCVGASESLLQITSLFELEDVGGAFVYVKRG
jgi:chemotaxis protein methyltransferase CheR